ncbi:DUF6476 family protein [Teichococcus aestuarii]|uniref:Uncharacterized protein n=1 Tax=Teichococcus aestuarii TaxID=568898 RepID=A0A2U1VAC8_9PROT|nr:DUF6476 family protein [Pseudoroseomonas aestuarii]PWC30879.1 hypothetical protein CR165_00510 [Pseudoroseomonas aestuarii]
MRGLKILVVVMGVMIIVATVALVVALVQRMNSAAGGVANGIASGVSTDLALRQPPGSRIGQIAVLDGRLAVWVERPDGARILLVDPRGGRVAGEIRLGE